MTEICRYRDRMYLVVISVSFLSDHQDVPLRDKIKGTVSVILTDPPCRRPGSELLKGQ